MAHFAKINDENIVEQVIVIHNDYESNGQKFITEELGLIGKWIQTSYNNKFRKQFAGIGYFYDATNDVFIAPKPYSSWILDENFDWQAPISKPEEGFWYWDELEGQWVNGETL